MSNVKKFISEAKTHMVKRGWLNDGLFSLYENDLYLYGNYYGSKGTYIGIDYIKQDTYIIKKKLVEIVKWTFEHISYLWIKHKIGSKTLTATYYDISVHFIIDEFGVPTKI